MTLGTRFHGIYSLEDVRVRCRMDGEHWMWGGNLSGNGQVRLWAPNLARGGEMTSQNGRRAVWQLKTGKPIPEGHKVYCTCGEELCLNPAHMACRRPADHGRIVAQNGSLKGIPSKIAANRKIVLARSKVTPETYRAVMESDKTGLALSAELGIGRTTISRIRTGQFTAILAVAALPFAGLGARRA
jgi:hypothetical protein